MIGKTIGKYRFVEELGRDGTSTLYKAVDETLEREVAVKVLNPELTDSEVMKHFQAEATTLARLHHPDIAGIHEIHRTESDLLLVMELVRGETLDQLATRCGPLPSERAAYLVAQVLGALEHAHGAGVVHRDLKPSNVMVTEQGGIKVLDFGMARVASEDQMTADGFAFGSPAYISPERLAGKDLDGRADVYSAGVIFYRLLTGHVPFEAATPLEMVQKQLTDAPTPASTHRPDLPGWCLAILGRALARSPGDRFSTAAVFRATLLAAIGEATESTGVFAVPQSEKTPSPSSRGDEVTAVSPSPAAAVRAAPIADLQTVTAVTPAASGVAATDIAAQAVTASLPSRATTGTTLVLKKNQFALVGGLLLVLVVGVILLAVAALRRPAQIVSAPSTSVEPSGGSLAPASTSSPDTPATATPPATAAPLETVAPPLVLPPSSAPPPAAPSVTPSAAPRGAAPASAPAPATAKVLPSTPPPLSPPTAARVLTTTPFSFEAKAVVADGDKRRERDAVVLLADGAVTVKDKNEKVKTLYVVAFDSVVGLTFSNSRQPLWNSPTGPAEAMRVEGGAFGFLKGGGGRNWFGLRTKDSLLVLRVDDDAVANVTAGLEQRTGLTLERLVERKEP